MSATTLLWGALDLSTADGVLVTDLSGIYAPGTRKGDHDNIPGADGSLGAALPFAAYDFSVSIVLNGATESEMHARLATLGAALVATGGLATLTRRLAAANEDGYLAYTAAGAFRGFSGFTGFTAEYPELAIDLLFTNLDGRWTRAGDSMLVVP